MEENLIKERIQAMDPGQDAYPSDFDEGYIANPAAVVASEDIIQGIDAALEDHADGQAEMRAWKDGIKLPPREARRERMKAEEENTKEGSSEEPAPEDAENSAASEEKPQRNSRKGLFRKKTSEEAAESDRSREEEEKPSDGVATVFFDGNEEQNKAQNESDIDEETIRRERERILAEDLAELDDGFDEDDGIFRVPLLGGLKKKKKPASIKPKKPVRNKKNPRVSVSMDAEDGDLDEELLDSESAEAEAGSKSAGRTTDGDKAGSRSRKRSESEKRMEPKDADPDKDEPDSNDSDFDDLDDEDWEDEDPRLSEEERRRIFSLSLKAGTHLMVIAVVLIFVIVTATVISRWGYKKYDVIMSRKQEDTLTARYSSMDRNILRYSTDGASLSEQSGEILWDVSYTMNNPRVSLNGGKAAIYDKAGTNIVICDEDGSVGTASASLPIVKAEVSASGTVATIEEDASGTWIYYYKANGDKIAAIKTSIDNPGYPMDVSVSGDGSTLAVSYLSIEDGTQKGVVNFYNFGAVGQNQMDNRIASFAYTERIIPDLYYMTDTTVLALRDDGFSVYDGDTAVEEKVSVQVEGVIQSVFYDDTHIGMLLAGEEANTTKIRLFDINGKELLDTDVEFSGQRAEIVGGEICLYNAAQEIGVFDMKGKRKYQGSYDGAVQQIFGLDHRRFVVVSDNSVEVIRLK
ncbi:MAG: DUF5711 family protein [Eubacteriales bacterium]|nr:DUF5711 family protein [Eubacteriales bacterium]